MSDPALRRWFLNCYHKVDVAAVEDRFHVVYPDPPIPDHITDVDEAMNWYHKTAREWIVEQGIAQGLPAKG